MVWNPCLSWGQYFIEVADYSLNNNILGRVKWSKDQPRHASFNSEAESESNRNCTEIHSLTSESGRFWTAFGAADAVLAGVALEGLLFDGRRHRIAGRTRRLRSAKRFICASKHHALKFALNHFLRTLFGAKILPGPCRGCLRCTWGERRRRAVAGWRGMVLRRRHSNRRELNFRRLLIPLTSAGNVEGIHGASGLHNWAINGADPLRLASKRW